MDFHEIKKFDTSSYKSNRNSIISIFSEFFSIAENNLLESSAINIICRGSSGCFTASIFYECFLAKPEFETKDIRVIYIRKDKEDSHYSGICSLSNVDGATYIWVDDFIDGGKTISTSFEKIRSYLLKMEKKGVEDFKFNWAVCGHSYTAHTYLANFTHNLVCAFS